MCVGSQVNTHVMNEKECEIDGERKKCNKEVEEKV